jgi:hypothetical protein
MCLNPRLLIIKGVFSEASLPEHSG